MADVASSQGGVTGETRPAPDWPARTSGARWGGLPLETAARHDEEREIDARVVAQASHGDRAAFTAIVRHYEHRLRVIAYQILQDPQAMDDALQEVFAAAYSALPGFRGDAALGTWLHRITCNVCLQSLRTASRRPAIADDPLDDGDLPAWEETAAVIDKTAIAEALAALPAEQRILVLLVDRDGYDYRTAAELVGIPRGTVASRLAGGRAALRARLGLEATPAEEER